MFVVVSATATSALTAMLRCNVVSVSKMSRSFVFILTLNSILIVRSERWIAFRAFGFVPLEQDDRSAANSTANDDGQENRWIRNSDDAFWLPRRDNQSLKGQEIEVKNTTEKPPRSTTSKIQLSDAAWSTADDATTETVFLPRGNCDLEMQIKEADNRKLRIEYEGLRRGVSGRCRTTLRCKNGIYLAVLVTNLRLLDDEVLSVVTKSFGFDFTLKEYRGNDGYGPVILSETNETYLVLVFNATRSHRSRSSFDLEVFDYRKNETRTSHSGYVTSRTRDVDDVYITTDAP